VADWSLIVATAAGVGTVTLGVFQYRLSERQTALFERQTALEEARARRESGPQLDILPSLIQGADSGADYQVMVRNRGGSAARGVYMVGYIAGEEAARSPDPLTVHVGASAAFVLVFGPEQVERAGGRDAISRAVALRAFDHDDQLLAQWP
jgi:hypothetical protein